MEKSCLGKKKIANLNGHGAHAYNLSTGRQRKEAGRLRAAWAFRSDLGAMAEQTLSTCCPGSGEGEAAPGH